MPGFDWNDWDEQLLRKAEEEGKVVLLFLVANWCRYSREMEQVSFAAPAVQDLIRRRFVPIRVDADRRPDLDSRYNVGGWPTLALLTPEGELIAGENHLEAAELESFLRKVLEYYANNEDEIRKGIRIDWQPSEPPSSEEQGLANRIVEHVTASILDKFDHKFGGWGENQKFAHPESLDFAMVQFAKTLDRRMSDVVTKTLDHMIAGGIHDSIGGGFFRFSTTPDWRVPHYEKMLDNNALRLRCLLEAYQLFGNETYREAAEGVVRWMTTTMLDEDTGCFFGSQGDSPEYYSLSLEQRENSEGPSLDRTIYCNWNAMAVGSLLRAAVILDRPDLKKVAMRAIDFLLGKLYHEDEGMYHYWDGTYHLPGVLSDQAYMIQALVLASQFTGDADLLLPAERIAELLMETHRAPGGGFYDLPESVRAVGALRKRNRSILENSVLAEALLRLSYLSRRDEFQDVASETISAFSGDYREYGYFVAGYARAVDLLLYEPLVVTVVGDRESELAHALRFAAQRSYVASRVVQTLDPKFDPILLKRSGFAATERPRAYLSVGRTTLGAFEDPEHLEQKIRDVEEERHKRISEK